jgi:hypothetical protein
VNTEVFRVSPGLPLFRNLEGVGLKPQKWAEDYLSVAPRYLDITSTLYCSVEGSNQGMERIGRERIAFMIRTDDPVRTDKFDYDDDEQLTIHQFESRHVDGDWHLVCTKLESSWVYALLVDTDELTDLNELLSNARGQSLEYPPVARCLRKLERHHIVFPGTERTRVSPTRFVRQFPDDEIVVGVSQFVVIRSLLAVNYVNGRFVRLPERERPLIDQLAKAPIRVPVSKKALRRRLEKLHRLGVVNVHA